MEAQAVLAAALMVRAACDPRSIGTLVAVTALDTLGIMVWLSKPLPAFASSCFQIFPRSQYIETEKDKCTHT